MENFHEKRYKIAKILAGIGTVFGVIVLICMIFVPKLPDALAIPILIVWAVGTLGGYICGGLWKAIKMSLGIAKWGFVVMPFPMNLMLVVFTAFFAILFFLFVPIIPVVKAAKEYGA